MRRCFSVQSLTAALEGGMKLMGIVMPSPFPGMDPYLEGEMWQEFHQTLAHEIRAQLISRLPPNYVALLAKHSLVTGTGLGIADLEPPRALYPDVQITQIDQPEPLREGPASAPVAEPAAELASPMIEEAPLLSIEIRDLAQRRLVTLIEILSPMNKRGEGARLYHQRRLEVLETHTHLLEIDLLRQGGRIVLEGTLPPAAYYVFLSRTDRRPCTQIWPIALPEVLPVVPVPLLHPDPDVALDLQGAVNACFALVGYERLLDYSKPPPPPPLTEAEKAWVTASLQKSGIRGL